MTNANRGEVVRQRESAGLDEDQYTYRPPLRVLGLVLIGLFLPPFAFTIYGAVSGPWPVGILGSTAVILAACLTACIWSKIWIVIDSERIRWPLKRRELRWDEVETSEIMKVLGLEYVRVTKKSGKVTWIALGRRGGEELERRLLLRLGLD